MKDAISLTAGISAAFLKGMSLFAALEDRDLEAVAESFVPRRYKKSAMVVQEGDDADGLYVVLKGHVGVSCMTEGGKESLLSILKVGDIFGEMAMIDRSPRSASVTALSDSEFAVLLRERFVELLGRRPQLSHALMASLCDRIRSTNATLVRGALDVRARLASTLLRLEQGFGEKTEGGTRLTIRLTDQQMANMIGTTRETVNRTLNSFWDEKLIDRRTRDILISDDTSLARIATQ